MCETPGLSRFCRESYNQPIDVYSCCTHRGMSLVTITDHDSIDAAETLRRYPDFFLSEEVTCQLPGRNLVHLGVYNLSERDHTEIQRRRSDFIALVMYLSERKLYFSANHIFSGLTGPRERDDFQWLASYVPAVEVRNGQMLPYTNESALGFASRYRKTPIAGSDSHTLAGIARTFTEVSGARSADDFFAGLRAGHGRVRGAHGNYCKLTADIFRIAAGMFREKPWALALLPLAPLIPIVTAAHWLNELRFCRKWSAVLAREERTTGMLWEVDQSWESI
jgi:predicted metal-dependent phosphoesterase TrpH